MAQINALSQEGAKNRQHFLARRARRAKAKKERLQTEKIAADSRGITLGQYRYDRWRKCQAIIAQNEDDARVSREEADRRYAERYR